jgi:hypothetical protein
MNEINRLRQQIYSTTHAPRGSIAGLDEKKGLFVNHEDPEFVKYLYQRDTKVTK